MAEPGSVGEACMSKGNLSTPSLNFKQVVFKAPKLTLKLFEGIKNAYEHFQTFYLYDVMIFTLLSLGKQHSTEKFTTYS